MPTVYLNTIYISLQIGHHDEDQGGADRRQETHPLQRVDRSRRKLKKFPAKIKKKYLILFSTGNDDKIEAIVGGGQKAPSVWRLQR